MHQSLDSSMFAIPMYSKGVFLNGILHMSTFDNMLVAVDVEGNNWWIIHPPTTLYYRDGPGDGIFQSQGSLYFASSTAGSELSVWVLEDYSTENWTLKHNVSHLQLFRTEYSFLADDFTIISIHLDNNLIFIVAGDERTLMSYDMDTMEQRFICQLGSDCQVQWCGLDVKTPYLPYVPLFSELLADGH
uniref:Uncharacterized protein n=1 Tax=Avena sativa TaxID=4498 RepID=A0ACD5XF88_AVESA